VRRALGRILIAGLALAAAGAAGLGALWHLWTAPGPLAEPRALVVPRGAGLEEIAHRLAEAGIVADARVFGLGVVAERLDGQLKAGEFHFPASVSAREAARLLASGRTVARRLTVPEGATTQQALALLRAAEGLEGEVATPPAEGALLPETWFYAWGDQRGALLDRQRRAMDQLVAELWAKRAPGLPLRGPAEAVILASIVEKETAIAAERPRVAAVFLNRLRRGMRLQADPTVVYGLTRGAGPLDRPLSRADLDAATPWNTYVIDGLPPTPIANPGRAALEATLQPAPGDELYFVADGQGAHVFARTLAEHNANVARLRALERARAAPKAD
jgi:UPF0755 protein